MFDPQQRAGLHAIEVNKPAPDFFEGGVLGNGGMGVIVCTRPDAVVLYFGHNNVWDIRLAENNRDRLLTFDEVWERLRTSSTPDGPGVRSPGFSPDGTTEITVDLARYPDTWFKDYCAMAGENYDQEFPRPWPCGSLVLGFDRRRAELLGHRVHIDTGTCEISFLVDGAMATLEIFVEMASDRLWMRMIDADRVPIEAPFDRARLIPEAGFPAVSTATGHTLAFRQVLPALGDARDKDRALGLGFRIDGSVAPGFRAERTIRCSRTAERGARSRGPGANHACRSRRARRTTSRRHTPGKHWRDYWSRSGVRLGDESLERTWYRNLYFLNCAVRPGVNCPGLFANWSNGPDRLDLARRLPHELQPPAAVLGHLFLEPCRQTPRVCGPRRLPAAREPGVGSRLLRTAWRLLSALGVPGGDAPDAVSRADLGGGGVRDPLGGAKPLVAFPLHDGHGVPARSGIRSDSRGGPVPERVHAARAHAWV